MLVVAIVSASDSGPADAHARLVCQSNLLPAEYNQFIVQDPLSNVGNMQPLNISFSQDHQF